MFVIRALDGTDVSVNEDAITLISGPYPGDHGTCSYVHGIDRGVLVAAEDARALVSRLGVAPPLAKLTRPDLTPVWIKSAAVTAIRPPLATEQQHGVKTVVILGELHQAVGEDLTSAMRILNPAAARTLTNADPIDISSTERQDVLAINQKQDLPDARHADFWPLRRDPL